MIASMFAVAAVCAMSILGSATAQDLNEPARAPAVHTEAEMPQDITLTGEKGAVIDPDNDDVTTEQGVVGGGGGRVIPGGGYVTYRYRYYVPRFRGGYYGWRYPLPYWYRHGRRFYGRACPYGRVYGDYYYC
ncbi:hypothetical protein Poli38472_006515 [Pythium oligandrum]|uniref:Uncharacterized protein n=1 Tax=Pythium oligandrum TaxID=41045 RepID=A0A8K1FAR9_PYTOL|nr:hypothetical protein Poli38472_006515 [Pythium oligandrum]|eukprot:TMW56505.1 hypothetical protein Poli38472_006515 [Pythium oligandrum]